MEPTNPNANTYSKTNTQTILDTLVGDTFVGHSCRTHSFRKPLWDTLAHSCGKPCRTLLWDTLVGHSCQTLWSDIVVGRSCKTLLCDTHSCGHSLVLLSPLVCFGAVCVCFWFRFVLCCPFLAGDSLTKQRKLSPTERCRRTFFSKRTRVGS